ncbi:hypothetical protein CRYUN_Cryun02cG0104300 [Craigia yunnanensis]
MMENNLTMTESFALDEKEDDETGQEEENFHCLLQSFSGKTEPRSHDIGIKYNSKSEPPSGWDMESQVLNSFCQRVETLLIGILEERARH